MWYNVTFKHAAGWLTGGVRMTFLYRGEAEAYLAALPNPEDYFIEEFIP